MKITLMSFFFASRVLAAVASTNEIHMAELKVGTNTTYRNVTLTKKSPLHAVARYNGGIAKVKIEDIANLPEPMATEWKSEAVAARKAIEDEAQKALAAKKAEEEAERDAWQQAASRRVGASSYPESQSATPANHGADAATGMALLIFLGCLYFIPSIVASSSKHRNTAGIVILNLFLGWTLLGWVIALIWSVSSQKPTAT